MPRIELSRRLAKESPRAHVVASLIAHDFSDFVVCHKLSLTTLAEFWDESASTAERVVSGRVELNERRGAMLPQHHFDLWTARIREINRQIGAEF